MSTLDGRPEDWTEMAKIYKQLTTGVNNKPIEAILSRLDAMLPWAKADGILDNGCGPGPIISALISKYGSSIAKTSPLLAADFSAAMIDQVNATKKEETAKNSESPWNRVETAVQNAMDMKDVPDDSKSHITAGWVYFMTSDPQKCLSESKRILKKDGVLGLSSWKGSQWIEIMNLLPKLRPDKTLPTIPREWSDVVLLKVEMDKAGFEDVETVEVPVQMHFEEYDALIDLLVDRMPHMVKLTADMSPEERQRLKNIMLDKTKEFAPTVPGTLQGTALIALGRKG